LDARHGISRRIGNHAKGVYTPLLGGASDMLATASFQGSTPAR
jgi:hypothetical protein